MLGERQNIRSLDQARALKTAELEQRERTASAKLVADREAKREGFSNNIYLEKLRQAKTPEEVAVLQARERSLAASTAKAVAETPTPEEAATREAAELEQIRARTESLKASAGQVGVPKIMSEADKERIRISQERLNLSRQKNVQDQMIDIIGMEEDINKDPTDPAVVPLMDHVNNVGSRPYYYKHEEVTDPLLGGPTTKGRKIPLPKNPQGQQITMDMVRNAAAANNTTIEEILKAINAL